MRAFFYFVLIAFLVAPGVAGSGTILLRELQGDYTGDDPSRSVSVDFGGPVADLTAISLELHGMFDTTWIAESGLEVSWCASFGAVFLEPDPGFWMAVLPSDGNEGEFHATVDFNSLFGATWDFLAGGAGTLTFEFTPCAPVGGPGSMDWSLGPFGSIYSANLIYDGTGPEESLTFSAIKALYR